MAENVDNIILEQRPLIREDIAGIKADLDEARTGQQGVQGVLFGLAGYMRDIDQRVEDPEGKLGGTA